MGISNDSLTGREKHPLTRADVEAEIRLAGSSENLDLTGMEIHGDLSNLDLHGADLSRADLSRANLMRTRLIGTKFVEPIFNRTQFDARNISSVLTAFTERFLDHVALKGDKLHRTKFVEANLNQANLKGANLSGVDFSGANLSQADLSGADLNRTKFVEADLKGANLSRADLRGADLRGADLRGADLRGANPTSADLSGTNLSGVNLRGINLREVNLKGADLSEVDLRGIDLNGTNIDIVPNQKNSHNSNNLTQYLEQLEHFQEKQEQSRSNEISTLQIRIDEESLTASHLSETLDTLISLYVKMWLLQQDRFDDFLLYTETKDRRFEEEAHLPITELKYNSPADIKFNIDLSPKSVIEALQMFVDMITQRRQRAQAEKLKLFKEQLSIIEQSADTAKHIVETVAPGLDADQKGRAIQSVLTDLHKIAQDQTLVLSLNLSASAFQTQHTQIIEAKQPATQQSEQTASGA